MSKKGVKKRARDLEMVGEVMDNAMYEPEQFPGLIYRMTEPKVVFLLFSSGKIVITGGKSEKEVKQAAEKIRAILKDHELMY